MNKEEMLQLLINSKLHWNALEKLLKTAIEEVTEKDKPTEPKYPWTEGEWKPNGDKTEVVCWPPRNGSFKVLTHVYCAYEEQKANTQLMSCAPEMYEALEIIEDLLDDGIKINCETTQHENIKTLLKKARGEK